MDIGGSLEYILGGMDDRNEERERVREISASKTIIVDCSIKMHGFGVMGTLTIVGYLMPNPCLYIKEFYFK